MSLQSMTGYGRGEGRGSGMQAVVELGSVNRRQLDLQISLPRPLQALEARVQEEIVGRLARGRVTVSVQVGWLPQGAARHVRWDKELVRAWTAALRGAAKECGLRDDVGVSALLSVPDAFVVESPQTDTERVWPVIRTALRKALEALVRMRAREGRALAHDIRGRLNALAAMTRAISARAPGVVERHRAALLARLQRAGLPFQAEDPAIVREIALFADRSDITEELTRLRSHLDQGRRMLRERAPVGRALDFLTQEMLREINTLAAKCADGDVAAETVRYRAEIERLREQVQNVE